MYFSLKLEHDQKQDKNIFTKKKSVNNNGFDIMYVSRTMTQVCGQGRRKQNKHSKNKENPRTQRSPWTHDAVWDCLSQSLLYVRTLTICLCGNV